MLTTTSRFTKALPSDIATKKLATLPLCPALFNRHLNPRCLVYMFSLRFSGSRFLTNLRRQFRVRKIFRTQVFVGFAVFIFYVENCYFKNA